MYDSSPVIPYTCVLSQHPAHYAVALQDLATMLTVRGLSGRVKALYGAFEPAQKTQGGCQCAQVWSYQDSAGSVVTVKGQCVNPFGHSRAWCQYEPESCTGGKSI